MVQSAGIAKVITTQSIGWVWAYVNNMGEGLTGANFLNEGLLKYVSDCQFSLRLALLIKGQSWFHCHLE